VLRSALLDMETKWCGTGALTNGECSELNPDSELYLVSDRPLKLINYISFHKNIVSTFSQHPMMLC